MAFTTQNAGLLPAPSKQLLNSNYLQWTEGAGGGGYNTEFADFAQQYLPELYEQEVERFGNRTISGFLRMVGAEMPMTSDQVIWSEQNRLHVSYQNCNLAANTLTLDAVNVTVANPHVIKPNQTLVLSNPTTNETVKVFVDQAPLTITATTVDVYMYAAGGFPASFGAATNLVCFVYGSDYEKGTLGLPNNTAITPSFTEFSNRPIIIKDQYEVSGSDAAQIGWVEVATEDGTSGFLWYMKAESETRLRFEDYLEMTVVEGEIADAAGQVAVAGMLSGGGTQGMFSALETRGNVYAGFAGAAAPGSGAMTDFDDILQWLDFQGAIEENMLFLDRATALDFDDMIAAQAGGGYSSVASASYGLFDNAEEMALNFGFSGFRRGSYDFYKTDWKYLNDASTRGLVDNIKGVLIPAGTSTVYDQMLGSNIRRPFLHVRYRASETDDRRMKSWITGSVGGAYTSSLDAMEVHYLSERCLCVQAANNFVLFTA